MQASFGKKLRKRRFEVGMGLRELAKKVNKSPGYISDIEKGRVAPPSEKVIIRLAEALDVDKQALLSAAGKMDPDLSTYLINEPGAADFVRMARDRGFYRDDWARLNQLADIARLGKKKKKN